MDLPLRVDRLLRRRMCRRHRRLCRRFGGLGESFSRLKGGERGGGRGKKNEDVCMNGYGGIRTGQESL